MSDVIDSDRVFAAQIIEDFAEFEEGITSQEKMAEWVRNIRCAALKSVREPSEAMVDAGYEAGGNTWDPSDVPAAWRAMIDAALK